MGEVIHYAEPIYMTIAPIVIVVLLTVLWRKITSRKRVYRLRAE